MAENDKKYLSEVHKKKRGLNMAIAWTLVALVSLFFIVTIVKIGGNVASRPF